MLLVCVTTLALSVAFGLLLSKLEPVDQATSSFGMIAGGAAGIISISRELGADERLVAVLQYTRVLIIVALTPLVGAVAFGIESTPHPPAGGGADDLTGVALVVLCTAIGLPLARLVRLPAGGLLGPMILALLAACAALGIALASLAGVSRLDGYLAWTPGGLSAVLALSVGSRTNTTFILAVQLVRTFVMLLAAPPLARWIARRWGRELAPGSEAGVL